MYICCYVQLHAVMRLGGWAVLAKRPKDQTTKRQLCGPILAIKAISAIASLKTAIRLYQRPSTENVPTS